MSHKKALRSRLSLASLMLAAVITTGCGGSTSSPAIDTTPTGTFGGTRTDLSYATPATLTLTASGGHLDFPCDSGIVLNQSLVTDNSGHFSITAIEYSGVPGPRQVSVVVTGTASGDTITLDITDKTTHASEGTYTVVKGKAAPPSDGGCPG